VNEPNPLEIIEQIPQKEDDVEDLAVANDDQEDKQAVGSVDPKPSQLPS
jgi:hypothetical protein